MQDPRYFDPDQVLSSGGITASVTGTTVNATGSIFTPDMAVKNKVIWFPNPSDSDNPVVRRIIGYTSDISVTINSAASVSNQPFWIYNPRFTITAVSLAGDNIRIRRVRCINFGTRTPLYFDGLGSYSGPNRTYEGFPIRIEGRTYGITSGSAAADQPAFNSWMEDCIIESPTSLPA